MARTKAQENKIKEKTQDELVNKKIKADPTRHYIDCEEEWEKSGKPNIMFFFTGRGTGKTTSMACWMAEYCTDNHKQFILISRDAFKQVQRKAWFHNVVTRGLTPYDVRCEGNTFKVGDQIIGYNYSLHAYSDYRSVEFPEVDFIVFEEFVELEYSNYWSDNGVSEAQFLSDLVTTIFRDRSDGACFLLGNNNHESSKFNPYFEAFGIDWDENDFQMNHAYEIRNDGRLHVVLYYGGMGRDSEDLSDVKGWTAWMPLNDVALTGDFAPDPLILSNFLHDNGIDLANMKPDGTGLALCTQGLIEYITYYEYEDEQYHIVSRQAFGRCDYEPYRIKTKAQAQRFWLNHGSYLLYESSKDKNALRKALDPDKIGITENQRNLENYTKLLETDRGCLEQDVKIRTFRDLDRWGWVNMGKLHNREEFEEKLQEAGADVNPFWKDTVFSRYENMLLTS